MIKLKTDNGQTPNKNVFLLLCQYGHEYCLNVNVSPNNVINIYLKALKLILDPEYALSFIKLSL